MEKQDRAQEYLDLFGELRASTGDEQSALGILQELGKDGRVEKMRGVSARPGSQAGVGFGSETDQSATAKQLLFLKRLGVNFDQEISKQDASRLIDEAQMAKAA